MRRGLVVLLICFLAGCTGPNTTSEPVITLDSTTVVVADADENPEPRKPHADTGIIYGIVVDAAIRPISGAEIRLPGLDASSFSRSDGSFNLDNVPAGGTFVRVAHPDYHPQGVEVVVVAGKLVEVHIVLEAISREPYVQVESFAGFADISSDLTGILSPTTCRSCTHQWNIEPTAEASVAEFVSNRPAEVTGAWPDRFWVVLEGMDGTRETSWHHDPGRMTWPNGTWADQQSITVKVYPYDLVPVANVEFEVFLASFYNGASHEQWTLVGTES